MRPETLSTICLTGLIGLAGVSFACAHGGVAPHEETGAQEPPHPHEYAPIESFDEVLRGVPDPEAIAADFSGETLEGEVVDLAGTRKEHDVVLLTYFAEWCENCRYEAPELVRMHERFADEGFAIIARSEYSHPDEVRAFVERYGIDYPVLVGSPNPDPESEDEVRTSTTHYRLRRMLGDERKWGTPFNLLLADGEIFVVAGEFEPGALEAFLEERL